MSIPLPQNSSRGSTFDSVQNFSEDEIKIPPARPTSTKRTYIGVLFAFLIVILASLHYSSLKYEQSNPEYSPVHQLGPQQIVDIPHDTSCYTQGLSFLNETHILESCGLYAHSYFHILEYDADKQTTKEVYKSPPFDKKYFIQGSVYFPKTQFIYVLTWKEKVIFKIDPKSEQKMEELPWFYEGWGLTNNNSHFIVSDGSNKLYVTDANFTIFEVISVTDSQNLPVSKLNQLEWIEEKGKQYVYANLYQTDKIVKIDLLSGKIVETHRFPQLTKKQREDGHLEVMNGIAYHEKSNRFIITGKKWGKMYAMNYL